MMKQFHTAWEAPHRSGWLKPESGPSPFMTCGEFHIWGERGADIETWTGNSEELQRIVEANERMSFLSRGLAELRAHPQPTGSDLHRHGAGARAAGCRARHAGGARRSPGRSHRAARIDGGEARIEVVSVPLESFLTQSSKSPKDAQHQRAAHDKAASASRCCRGREPTPREWTSSETRAGEARSPTSCGPRSRRRAPTAA